MKRALSLVFCLLMFVSLAACNTAIPVDTPSTAPSPSPSISTMYTVLDSTLAPATATPVPTIEMETPSPEPEETEEPEPVPEYNIPDIKKVGLTNEQFQKIDLLLYGALAMDSGENGPPAYFADVNGLTPPRLFNFLTQILCDTIIKKYENYKDDNSFHRSIDKMVVEKVINSAFGIEYKSGYTEVPGTSCLSYIDGIYEYSEPQGSSIVPYVYSITALSPDKLKVQMDIVGYSDEDGAYHEAKAQAILQEDKNSLFGYHLLSLKKMKSTRPHFTSAQASSYVPAKGKTNYKPINVLDNKDSTVWMTDNGVGQWIKLTSGRKQTVSGIIMNFDADNENCPGKIRIEFSDGSSIVCTDFNFYISFGRAIKTDYIKITILGDDDAKEDGLPIHIADILPY